MIGDTTRTRRRSPFAVLPFRTSCSNSARWAPSAHSADGACCRTRVLPEDTADSFSSPRQATMRASSGRRSRAASAQPTPLDPARRRRSRLRTARRAPDVGRSPSPSPRSAPRRWSRRLLDRGARQHAVAARVTRCCSARPPTVSSPPGACDSTCVSASPPRRSPPRAAAGSSEHVEIQASMVSGPGPSRCDSNLGASCARFRGTRRPG